MDLIPVQPTEADARRIMAWRNDPLTRSMSFHQEPKRWPSFYHEFIEEYFAEPSLPPLYGMVEGQYIGLARFRPYPDPLPSYWGRVADVGIMIDPDQRSSGYGTQLIHDSSDYMHQLGWLTIVAELLPGNDASEKMVLRAGYMAYDVHERYIEDLDQTFTVARYIRREPRSLTNAL